MRWKLFKTAFRNIRKGKLFSFINIFGLAMGLSACLLIALFVVDEFSYDCYNDKADRIFRIVSDIHLNGNSINSNATPSPMGPALVTDYPGIEKAVRIRRQENMLVIKGDEKKLESNVVLADPTLFDVFTLPLVAGNPRSALVEPNSIVISERIAKKYFNTSQVIGKTLVTENNMDTSIYKITAVIKDMPSQSHFHFDFIKPMPVRKFQGMQWINFYSATYVLTKPGLTNKDIDRMLAASVTKYIGPQLQENLHSGLDDLAKNGDYFRFYSMPLSRIHLYSNVSGEFESNGKAATVYIFIVIAVFILLIAGTNFMNLATARSADRCREVGVRKVLGASRGDLITGFLVESVLTSLIALLLAVLIAALLLPYFNQLSGKRFNIGVLGRKWILIGYLLGPIVIGILAGSYPAFYLSAFKPIQVLKGRLALGFSNGWFRNSLVVFQFATGISLIIGTLVIYRQLNYIQNMDLGFNRNQVLTVSNTGHLGSQASILEERVRHLSGVEGSTMTGFLPNRTSNVLRGYFNDASAKASATVLLGSWTIDSRYISVLGMKIISGRDFSPLLPTDSSGVLINESAARLLGYPDPLNKNVYTGPDPVKGFRILGVVKDFNAGTLRDKIEPIVFHLGEDRNAVSFRINTPNIPGLIAAIKYQYKSLDRSAGQPFVYSFMDDDFNKLYESDQRTGAIFISFTLFAIFIACLGLFGLANYAAERKTKETGIRKVLGATVGQIVLLHSADFLKLVILANVIAIPIGWWGMHRWLEDFAFRTSIGWHLFAIAGGATLLIAIVTVGLQALKAAMANPIKSLRTE